MQMTPGSEYAEYVRRHQHLAQHDPQLRELVPDPATEAALDSASSMYEALLMVFDAYAKRPALGSRAYDVIKDRNSGRTVRQFRNSYETVTYQGLRNRVTALATALRQDDIAVDSGDFIAIFGFTGLDFATFNLAREFVQAVSVPLQASAGRAVLEGILAGTAPVLVASTISDAAFVAELAAAQHSVRTLVLFDYDERVADDREAHAAASEVLAQRLSTIRLVTIGELLDRGGALTWEPPSPHPLGLERMALLVHSSGSTGAPKGAIHTERLEKNFFTADAVPLPSVRMHFGPLNHHAGHSQIYKLLAHGGTGYFVSKPDLSTLFEDIRLVRPTDGWFFPRALEMVYHHFQSEVARKLGSGKAGDEARAEVLADMRDRFLGDRLCLVRGGSAPTPPEVSRFIRDDMGIYFTDGYGLTETGNITQDDHVNRGNVLDYYLKDVPELGYYTTDRPYPRGELCVRTKATISGYFKNAEATARLMGGDGYVHTADIMEERGPDHLVYIDRRNDVLKLAQGDFVAVGALGTTIESRSEVVHQIYLYGTALRSYLVAVVVPNLALVRQTLGHDPDEAELRAIVRADLTRVAAEAELRPFEIPRDFVIETEPFSQEKGLLTPTGKRSRPAIQRAYGDQLEQLYADLERKQREELAALRAGAGGLTVREKIGKALEATLGIEKVDDESSASFSDLGGDSLGATAFAGLLGDIFGVEVPVNTILSPAGNPRQWAALIEASLADGARSLPTFATVHGRGAREIHVTDLELERFIDREVLENPAAEPVPTVPRTVLLTGATGFLGRFLCMEWLERLSPVGGKLICFVRGSSPESARQRLEGCFTGVDEAMAKRFHELSRDALEVVVGDVADASLGLSSHEYDRLAREVDRIVHPAALVNHVLDYEALFGPNVAGTAALIGLALTARQKAIDFVSSQAVSRFVDRGVSVSEDSPLLDTIALDESHANGYGASKWASEQLLHSATRRFGLPIRVFRGDMMLPHRQFRGQINIDDNFTRLVYSVIMTGLVPYTFYVPEADGSRPRAHYDGLPVDFIAGAIVEIGGLPQLGLSTYNVINHADDGLSLDVFVDWIEAAGYPIERVDDYGVWLERFQAKLRALPEEKRQRSSLGLLKSLSRPRSASGPAEESRHFDEILRTLQVGPDTPTLSQDYIEKCLDDMHCLGLIPLPDRRVGRSEALSG